MIPIKYNIRYLVRRWTSTLMTALTFALVVSVFIIVEALASGLERAFVSTGDPLNILVLRPGVQSEMQSSVSLDRYQVIRNFKGIAKDEAGEPLAAPEVVIIVNKPKKQDGKPTNLQVRGVHPQALKIRPQIQIVEGRMFKPGLREVIVSRSVAGRFQDMGLESKPHLGKGEWTVVGIFDGKGTAYDSEMWADYQEIMSEFDRNAYSSVVLRAIDTAAVKDLVTLLDEDVRIKLDGKTEVEYYAEQTKSAGPIKAFGAFLAVIMAIGACFAGMNTMYGSVANRVKEIGTLRILGFTPMAVLFSITVESIFLALFGGLIGCAVSYLMMNGVSTGTTNFQTFSEVVFFFAVTPRLMAIGLGFAAAMGFIGGFLPAFAASRTPIIQTMREI